MVQPHILVLYSTKHRREFDFRPVEPFGEPFSVAIASECLKQLEAGYSRVSADGMFRVFKQALGWVAKRQEAYPALFAAVASDYRTVPPLLWQMALDDWAAEYTDSGARSRGTAGGQISAFNTIWQRLINVLPKVEPLVPPRDYRAALGKRKTVAEVPRPTAELAKERSLDGVQESLALLPPVHQDKPRTHAAVAAAVEDFGGPIPTVEELEEALKSLPAARLQEIRSKAEDHLIEAYETFQKGQTLIKEREALAGKICMAWWAEWDHRLWGTPVMAVNALKTIRPYVTHCPDGRALSPDEALGNLLLFIDRELRGFVPRQIDNASFCSRFFHKDNGGHERVQAHLTADLYTLVAALIIILIDCDWNPSTGERLMVGCIRDSTRTGHFEIISFKSRADTPQSATLRNKALPPQRLTIKRVVAMIEAMTARTRAIADPETASRLLIHRLYGAAPGEREAVVLGEGDKSHKVFKRLQRRWGWANAPYTLDQFRSTGAVTKATTAGGVARAQTALRHASMDTTGSYLQHLPVELHWEAQIRGYQNAVMLIALRDIEGAARQLGVTTEEFERRLQHALRTGRGLLCADPYAGVQPDTKKGDPCTKVLNCWNCSQSFFVATVENTADLILWHEHLRAGADLKHSHPYLWYEELAPWWVLAEVLIGKVAKEFPEIYEDAQALAEELRESAQVQFRALA